MSKNKIPQEDRDLPVSEHLAELRKRIIIIIVPLIIFVVVLYYKVPILMKFLMKPVEKFNITLSYFTMTEAFVTRLKISLIASIIILFPLILYQFIAFIAPGLRQNEKKLLYRGLLYLSVLFVLGVLFAGIMIIPLALDFLISFGKSYMVPVISGDKYFSFVSMFCLIIGLAFDIPAVLVLLGKLGVLSSRLLKKSRKFVFFSLIMGEVFVIPFTDILTFVLIAAPIIILYEASILIIVFIEKRKIKVEL